jgi:hypothetical protein
MPKATKPKDDAGGDPDVLKRQSDGGYRSGDGRFSVEQANGSWFVADHEMADDFGQPRVIGPLATLKDAKVAIPRLRSEPTPLRKPVKQTKPKPKAEPEPKPETWLDRLDADERRRAHRIVRALEKEGLADADDLAQGLVAGTADVAALAQRLIRARLDASLADADADARRLVDDVLELLAVDGGRTARDLPGWALVAVDADGSVTDRRLDLT